jgi:hypothetical protein
MKLGDGYEVVWDEKAPKGRRIVKVGQGREEEVILSEPDPIEVVTEKPRRGRPPKSRD